MSEEFTPISQVGKEGRCLRSFVPVAQIGKEVRCLRSLSQLLRSEKKLDV